MENLLTKEDLNDLIRLIGYAWGQGQPKEVSLLRIHEILNKLERMKKDGN